MSAARRIGSKTFRALSVRNFRLYFFAQLISVSGTWSQSVALGWLVLRLTGSGVDLGFVLALQFLPMLIFGSFGGLVADRLEKRRLLYMTQGSAAVLGLALGILTLSHSVTIPRLYGFALLLGVVNLFDNPARQTFVNEMVGRELLPNAVSLNSVLMNSARVVGPAVAGIVLSIFSGHLLRGAGVCFVFNAITYLAVIGALLLMNAKEFIPLPRVARQKGQLREGFRYVWATPGLRNPLMVMAIVGIFAFNFTVSLALLARYTFGGGAGTYAALTAAMGSGAIVGGLFTAHRSRPSIPLLTGVGVAFGILICAVALAPDKLVAIIFLVPMGACSITFISTSNATLQLGSDPDKRGRVMSLFAIAFLGSTPIGAPLVGAVSSEWNPRVALIMGGLATVAAAGSLGVFSIRHRPSRTIGALGALAVATTAAVATDSPLEITTTGS